MVPHRSEPGLNPADIREGGAFEVLQSNRQKVLAFSTIWIIFKHKQYGQHDLIPRRAGKSGLKSNSNLVYNTRLINRFCESRLKPARF
jgi:hypothetical protein